MAEMPKQIYIVADVEVDTRTNMAHVTGFRTIDDVAPVVHGKWIGYPECLKFINAYASDHIVCSACEECFSIIDNCTERFNFCPHCGADMRGG